MTSYYFYKNIFSFQNNKEIKKEFFIKKMRYNPKKNIIAKFYNKMIDNATRFRSTSLVIFVSHQHLPTTCYAEDDLVTLQ